MEKIIWAVMAENYQAPSVEVMEVTVETGFEGSDADATVPDMNWDV